jgi:hypothetical protein
VFRSSNGEQGFFFVCKKEDFLARFFAKPLHYPKRRPRRTVPFVLCFTAIIAPYYTHAYELYDNESNRKQSSVQHPELVKEPMHCLHKSNNYHGLWYQIPQVPPPRVLISRCLYYIFSIYIITFMRHVYHCPIPWRVKNFHLTCSKVVINSKSVAKGPHFAKCTLLSTQTTGLVRIASNIPNLGEISFCRPLRKIHAHGTRITFSKQWRNRVHIRCISRNSSALLSSHVTTTRPPSTHTASGVTQLSVCESDKHQVAYWCHTRGVFLGTLDVLTPSISRSHRVFH